MKTINETVKNIIRIEKETYDLYRLVDKNKIDRKSLDLLKKCAIEASKNLQILEQKIWSKDPSLITFLHHFVPEFELEMEKFNECMLIENCIENRKSLSSLYAEVAKMNRDPDFCETCKEIASKIEPPVSV